MQSCERIFEAEQIIDRPIEEVFQFFSKAENLQRITPPILNFKILTPAPIDMKVGTLIDYRINIRGLPVTWRTKIELWDPPNRFADIQLKGPYKKWHHTHEFISLDPNKTLMKDRVVYEVPLGWLGLIANAILVKRDIHKIFSFRKATIEKIFAQIG